MTKKTFKTNQIIIGIISIIAGLFFAYFFRQHILLLFQSSSEKSIYYIFLLWPALLILGGILGILAYTFDKTVLSILQFASYFLAFYFFNKFGWNGQYWVLERTLVSGLLASETIFFLLVYHTSVRRKIREKRLNGGEEN